MNSRTRRSAVPTHITGTRSLGWKVTTRTAPLPDACASKFASRNRSSSTCPAFKWTFSRRPKIPLVEANKSAIPASSPASSFFSLRAFAAHAGSGFIRSYCRRRRASYSRPESVSSVGASRSLRSREEASDTVGGSEGSIQAGGLRDFSKGLGEGDRVREDDGDEGSASESPASASSSSWLSSSSPSSCPKAGAGAATPSSTKKS